MGAYGEEDLHEHESKEKKCKTDQKAKKRRATNPFIKKHPSAKQGDHGTHKERSCHKDGVNKKPVHFFHLGILLATDATIPLGPGT